MLIYLALIFVNRIKNSLHEFLRNEIVAIERQEERRAHFSPTVAEQSVQMSSG